jgi:hypothetical protein
VLDENWLYSMLNIMVIRTDEAGVSYRLLAPILEITDSI